MTLRTASPVERVSIAAVERTSKAAGNLSQLQQRPRKMQQNVFAPQAFFELKPCVNPAQWAHSRQISVMALANPALLEDGVANPPQHRKMHAISAAQVPQLAKLELEI